MPVYVAKLIITTTANFSETTLPKHVLCNKILFFINVKMGLVS